MSFIIETYGKINPLLFLKSWKVAIKECLIKEREIYKLRDEFAAVSGYILTETKIEIEIDFGTHKRMYGKQVFEQLKDAAGTLDVQLYV